MKRAPDSHRACRRNVLGLATVLCGTVVVPAFAEEAATAPVSAVLEEIIVTAQRREERLQDVPVSITVYEESQLKDRNVVSIADLATYTPSLMTNERFGSNNLNVALRGFQQELRTSATVGVYFADVVAPRGGNGGIPAGDGAGAGDFFDLQNVQVLKGPQGTLFGRNTTGGAILLVPQKPTDEFEGHVEVSGGNHELRGFQGVLNVPINERLRLRAGVDYQKRDGYLENLSGIGPRDFGNLESLAARLSVVADLTESLENYTIVRYSEFEDHGPLPQVTECTNNPGLGSLACAQMNRERALGGGDYTVWNAAPDPSTRTETWQLINTTTWQINDELTLKNILSYSELTNSMDAAFFGVVYPLGAVTVPFIHVVTRRRDGMYMADQKNYTEELQLQGSAFDDRLEWQAGLYYERSKPGAPTGTHSPTMILCSDVYNFRCTDYLAAAFRRPVLGNISSVSGEVDFRNLGLYGQGTYELTRKLNVTAGLRYTEDETSAWGQLIAYRFFQPNTPSPSCILPGTGTPDTGARCINRGEQKSDAVTGTLSLEFKPVDDLMLYGKYSRGYRQGVVSYNAPAPFNAPGPEQVDAYELGAKSTFGGALPGRLNVALFYNDLTDQQLIINAQKTDSTISPTQLLVNAGKSEIKGLEIDGLVQLFEGFTLSGSYAYIDAEIKELNVPSIPTGWPWDLLSIPGNAGAPLLMNPKNKWTATGAYRLPISAEWGDLTVSTTYSYTDDFVFTYAPTGSNLVSVIPSVGLWNLALNWNSIAGRPLALSLFATNLADEKHFVAVFDQRGTAGMISRMVAPPRMYGARLSYRF